MQDQIQRERKVELDKLDKNDANRIVDELVAKVNNMALKAKEDINKLLNIYGFKAEMKLDVYNLTDKIPQKRGRKKKN